jgi:hypothetical protein
MRYLTLLRATQDPATPPPSELMDAIMRLGQEAAASGNLLDFGGLMPSAAGARVTLTAGDLAVTDGPFAESKEVISYALYDVQTRAEAVEWSSRFLKLHRDLWPGWEGEVDVLQVFG